MKNLLFVAAMMLYGGDAKADLHPIETPPAQRYALSTSSGFAGGVTEASSPTWTGSHNFVGPVVMRGPGGEKVIDTKAQKLLTAGLNPGTTIEMLDWSGEERQNTILGVVISTNLSVYGQMNVGHEQADPSYINIINGSTEVTAASVLGLYNGPDALLVGMAGQNFDVAGETATARTAIISLATDDGDFYMKMSTVTGLEISSGIAAPRIYSTYFNPDGSAFTGGGGGSGVVETDSPTWSGTHFFNGHIVTMQSPDIAGVSTPLQLFAESLGVSEDFYIVGGAVQSGRILVKNDSNGEYMEFWTRSENDGSATPKMRLGMNGELSLNTTDKTYKLNVNGTAAIGPVGNQVIVDGSGNTTMPAIVNVLGKLSLNSVDVYKCVGGVNDSMLALGNGNAGLCPGGTWTITP